MFIIRNKIIFLALSGFLVATSVAAVVFFGLPIGIEFRGGSQMQFSYTTPRPDSNVVKEDLKALGMGESSVQPTGDNSITIKSRDLTQAERMSVITMLRTYGEGQEESFTNIGPSVGAELKRKAVVAVALVLIAIILFVAYAFRRVSLPVSSWKYGLSVIISLAHDIIICVGAFAVIGYVTGAEVDTLFIVALMTTLALSVSDTIVVFDRVRENLHVAKESKEDTNFEEIVGHSLSQTFARSVNTSLMVLIMVLALCFYGPASTRLFSIILAIGMFFGTYSSIFLASPLLVMFEKMQKKA